MALNHEEAAALLARHLAQPTAQEMVVRLHSEPLEPQITTTLDDASRRGVRVIRFIVSPIKVRRVEEIAQHHLGPKLADKIAVLVQHAEGTEIPRDPRFVAEELLLLMTGSRSMPRVSELEPKGELHQHVLTLFTWLQKQGQLPVDLERRFFGRKRRR